MLFLALMMGHAFADFVFQTEPMAKGKNRHNVTTPPPGQKSTPCWVYWLSAHALVHGAVVWMITGNMYLGIAEIVFHWMIDFGKCDNKYGVHTDQAMHIFCKILWSTF